MSVPPVKIPQTPSRLPGEWLLVTGAFATIAVLTLWPLAAAPGHGLTGPFGDPLLNAWILAWDAERLLHGLRGWWQAPQFFPASDTLAWSEHLLGIAVFSAPIYWTTGNAVLTYNCALLGSVVLAGIGMYLLARELTGRRDAALLAGLAYACLPYRAAQVTHLQVLVNGWMPIALWGLHRYFRDRNRRGLAVFVAAYLLQALSNGYFLFFLIVPAAVVCASGLLPILRRDGWARCCQSPATSRSPPCCSCWRSHQSRSSVCAPAPTRDSFARTGPDPIQRDAGVVRLGAGVRSSVATSAACRQG